MNPYRNLSSKQFMASFVGDLQPTFLVVHEEKTYVVCDYFRTQTTKSVLTQ